MSNNSQPKYQSDDMYGIIHRSFKGCIPSSQATNHSESALKDRPTIFVFGEEGVGKTILAKTSDG